MCVFVFVYLYLCICICVLYLCICICVFVFVYLYLCKCLFVFVCVYFYLCIYIFVFVFLYLFLCICICVFVFEYLYLYLCICIISATDDMQATEAGNESVGFVYNGGTLSPQCIEVNNHTTPSTSFSNFQTNLSGKTLLNCCLINNKIPSSASAIIFAGRHYLCYRSPQWCFCCTDRPTFAFNITAIAETLNQPD